MEFLLDSVILALTELPYNFWGVHEDASSHCNVLKLEAMADGVALRKRVLRSFTHGHSFCFVLQLCQLYKMLLSAMEKEASHDDDSEGIATRDGEGKMKAVF